MISEIDLIKLCHKNDRKGQQYLFDQYKRKVMGICLRYASCRMEADDIFQESFIRVFRSLDKENASEIKSLDAWITQITKNTAINMYQRNKYKYDISLEKLINDEAVTTDESALEKLSSDDLLLLIQSMPSGFRIIFNLFIMDGLNHKEIAEALTISESTSRSQLSRAKNWLREKLAEKEFHYEKSL